jgi:hypothetical protein
MAQKTDMPTAMDALRDEMRRFTLSHMGDFYKRIDKRQTFGIMMFSTKLAQLVEQPQLATASSVYVTNLCDPSDERCLLLDNLTDGLDQSSKTWFQ